MRRLLRVAFCIFTLLCTRAGIAAAQAPPAEANTKGPRLDKTQTTKIKIGVSITAAGGACNGIVASSLVPAEWPEQKVKIYSEDISPGAKVEYRTLDGTAKQMVVRIAQLANGQEAHAYVTFEVARQSALPPTDPTVFRLPDFTKLDHSLAAYTAASPNIDPKNEKIVAAAKEALAGKADATAWEKAAALYNWTQAKIRAKDDSFKGVIKRVADGADNCEEITSLFIALCRANKIPARMVWIPRHCYPEFYLVDDEGQGHWLPAWGPNAEALGGVPNMQPILQKGDNFKDPDRPTEKLRYLTQTMKSKGAKGGGDPKVKFTQQDVRN